jgi:hypothetical protein
MISVKDKIKRGRGRPKCTPEQLSHSLISTPLLISKEPNSPIISNISPPVAEDDEQRKRRGIGGAHRGRPKKRVKTQEENQMNDV